MIGFLFLALIVPLIGLILAVKFDDSWDLRTPQGVQQSLIYVGVTVIITLLIGIGLYFGSTSHKNFKEVLHYQINKMEHWERWSEEVTKTRQVACGTDKEGNTKYCTEYYQDTEYHGPYWYAWDNFGGKRKVSKKSYEKWKKEWANEKKVGFNKGSADWLDKKLDGNIYQINWPKTFATIQPYSKIGTYENKIRVSNSVFNKVQPSEEIIKKYPRPADKNNTQSIHNYGSPYPVSNEDRLLMNRTNAKLGWRKQVHIMVLLFPAEESKRVVDDVLASWNGPNKNELAIFVGLNKDKTIAWADVHSWVDKTRIHTEVRNGLLDMKMFSFEEVQPMIVKAVEKYWVRKEFSEFDYLKVEPKPIYMVLAFIIIPLCSFGLYYGFDKINERNGFYSRFHRKRINRFRI